jgi:hypothetical protein
MLVCISTLRIQVQMGFRGGIELCVRLTALRSTSNVNFNLSAGALELHRPTHRRGIRAQNEINAEIWAINLKNWITIREWIDQQLALVSWVLSVRNSICLLLSHFWLSASPNTQHHRKSFSRLVQQLETFPQVAHKHCETHFCGKPAIFAHQTGSRLKRPNKKLANLICFRVDERRRGREPKWMQVIRGADFHMYKQ